MEIIIDFNDYNHYTESYCHMPRHYNLLILCVIVGKLTQNRHISIELARYVLTEVYVEVSTFTINNT